MKDGSFAWIRDIQKRHTKGIVTADDITALIYAVMSLTALPATTGDALMKLPAPNDLQSAIRVIGMLHLVIDRQHAQLDRQQTMLTHMREATDTLDSERAANAQLTAMVEILENQLSTIGAHK